MKSKSIVTGNTHPADTAATKSEPFYKLTGSEAKKLYKAGIFDANAYVLMIIRSHGAAGWKWTFKVKDFCKDWEIPQRSFYRAISKLKSLDLLHWEAEDTITVWYGADIAQDASNNTVSVQKESLLVSKQKPFKNAEINSGCDVQAVIGINSLPQVAVPVPQVAVPVPQVAVPVPQVAVPVPQVAEQITETLTQSAPPVAADSSSDSFEIFKKSLSDCERGNFLDFGRKKASQLPRQPELPDKWVAANWEELRSQWEKTELGRTAKNSQTDWTQHPDWATWLEEMRESVPRFVALGTCFDSKTRRAIADWADERGLIWGEES